VANPISFARGAPSLDIVDVEGLRAAADRAFAEDPAGVTAYGTAVGYPPLRAWIAERHGVTPEQVMVTNGSMQADAFLFDALVSPGDAVIVERPTYDRTLLSLRGRGADVRMVELEADGIDVAAVERVLTAGARPKLAHIIPNFQNPAGCTMSREKRASLIDLATASRSSRTIHTGRCGSRARRYRRCMRWAPKRWSTRRRSRRRSVRGSASGTSSARRS
jgi:DNA-binding transcriptional MocR family regulator